MVAGPLIALLIFLGVYPKPITNYLNPAVKDTLSDVHKTDPAPQINAAPHLKAVAKETAK